MSKPGVTTENTVSSHGVYKWLLAEDWHDALAACIHSVNHASGNWKAATFYASASYSATMMTSKYNNAS